MLVRKRTQSRRHNGNQEGTPCGNHKKLTIEIMVDTNKWSLRQKYEPEFIGKQGQDVYKKQEKDHVIRELSDKAEMVQDWVVRSQLREGL